MSTSTSENENTMSSPPSSQYTPYCYQPWRSWDAYYCQDSYETYARAAHCQYGPSASDSGSMNSPLAVYADHSSAGVLNPQAAMIESSMKPKSPIKIPDDTEDSEDDLCVESSDGDSDECVSDLSYSVKLINPMRKSEYEVKKWRTNIKFKSLTQLEAMLKDKFSELKMGEGCRVGYIEPGHGWKGKQRWITDEDDLKDMYRVYNSKKEVLIWCFTTEQDGADVGKKRKQSGTTTSDPKRTKSTAAIEKKMTEAKDIVIKLREKHGKNFSSEQFHAWSQLIQLGKHMSYDEAPNYPFFGTSKKREKSTEKASSGNGQSSMSTSPDTPTKATPPTVGISPGRRINLRTECIQQLKQLGELHDNGNISSEQHEKLQDAIMSDIYKF